MVELLEADGDHGPVSRFHVAAEALEDVGEVVEAFKLNLQGFFLMDTTEQTGAKAISNDLRKGGKEGGRKEGGKKGKDGMNDERTDPKERRQDGREGNVGKYTS